MRAATTNRKRPACAAGRYAGEEGMTARPVIARAARWPLVVLATVMAVAGLFCGPTAVLAERPALGAQHQADVGTSKALRKSLPTRGGSIGLSRAWRPPTTVPHRLTSLRGGSTNSDVFAAKQRQREALYEAYNMLHSLAQVRSPCKQPIPRNSRCKL